MLKLKPFRQTPGLCGIASLKMVLDYYGVRKTEKELTRLAGATPHGGARAARLVKTARAFGLKAEVKDNCAIADIKKLLNKKIPVIVDWFSNDDGHYSVAVGVDKKNIYLQDPEIGGRRAVPLKTFQRVWFDFPGDYLRSKNDLIIRRMVIICR